MIAILHRLTHRAHCLLGDHAYVDDVPDAADGTRGTTLRLRCLYCARATAGIEQAAKGYAYSAGMDRPDPRLVMHNPRLRRCECLECQAKRAARRQKRGAVTPMKRTA